jgi:hypothetical protein
MVVLCLGLLPADGTRCCAEDAAKPQARAASAAKKSAPARSKPATAKGGTLLGVIVNALGDDPGGNRRRVQAVQDQNIRNLEAQFRPQFQQLLYTELAFLRRACAPDAKPFVEVAKAAKADLRGPLHEYVASMYGPRFQGGPTAVDPRAAMQKLIVPLVEAKLGPEKARLYRQECDKRAEARKHAVVVNLVAALDERLVLTAGQRAKLVESLSAKYENSWESNCEYFAFSGEYLPSIPEQSIVPLLSREQKSVWRDTSSRNGQVFFGMPINRGGQFGEGAEIQEISRMVEEVKNDR